MSFGTSIYNAIFRRNSVFVGSIFITAFFTDIVFNKAADAYFDKVNAGKQWKDIRDKYIQPGDEDEDDDDE